MYNNAKILLCDCNMLELINNDPLQWGSIWSCMEIKSVSKFQLFKFSTQIYVCS